MGLFGTKEKRQRVLHFMTAMKDIAERAAAPEKTGENDPKVLFERLHEACHMLSHVNKQKIADPATLQMVHLAADSVLSVYHKEDGLIEWENIEDILRVQQKPAEGFDLNVLPDRYKDKIAPKAA